MSQKPLLGQKLPVFPWVVCAVDASLVAYSKHLGLQSKELDEIATALANLPKEFNAGRTVVITNGAEPTTIVTSGSTPKEYPVHVLPPEGIVDTNGAGDAFAGGFVGALVLGKSVDEAVEVGHKLGAMCVGQVMFLHDRYDE